MLRDSQPDDLRHRLAVDRCDSGEIRCKILVQPERHCACVHDSMMPEWSDTTRRVTLETVPNRA
jgi:hypothetical protein